MSPRCCAKNLIAHVLIFLLSTVVFGTPAQAAGTADPLTDELARSTGGHVTAREASTSLVRFLHVRHADRPAPVRALAAGRNGAEPSARDFLVVSGALFGLTDQKRELSVERAKTEGGGRSFVRFQQKIDDLPVFGGELIVHMEPGGEIVSVTAGTSPPSGFDTTAAIDAFSARANALQLVSRDHRVD